MPEVRSNLGLDEATIHERVAQIRAEGDDALAEALDQALQSHVEIMDAGSALTRYMRAKRAEAVEAVKTFAHPEFDPRNVELVMSIQTAIRVYHDVLEFLAQTFGKIEAAPDLFIEDDPGGDPLDNFDGGDETPID